MRMLPLRAEPIDGLSGEEAARQERLHVPTAVRHEITIDGPACHLVPDAVRLEVRLPEITSAEREQLFRIRAGSRCCASAAIAARTRSCTWAAGPAPSFAAIPS